MSKNVKCIKCKKSIPIKTAEMFENCCYQCHQILVKSIEKAKKKKTLEELGYKPIKGTKNCKACNKEIPLVVHTKTGGFCYTCNRENRVILREKDISKINEKMICKPGCPMCDGTNKNYISWPYNQKLDEYEYYKKYPNYIIKYKEKSNYEFFSCSECSQIWYKEKNRESMSAVYSKVKNIFTKWLNNECIPNSKQINVLSKIGTLRGSFNSKYKINPIPCEIKKIGDKKYSRAIFIFSDSPPSGINMENAITPKDVESIIPSSKALSKELIAYSITGQEYKMGFSPVIVKSTENKKMYVLNGSTFFFKKDNIDAKSLKIVKTNFGKEHINLEVYDENRSGIQIVLCNESFSSIEKIIK